MRSLAVIVALSVMGSVATATPRPRSEQGVTITSAEDASPGTLNRRVRARHGDVVRQALLDVLRRPGADVRLAGIGPRQIDVSVVSWRVTPRARWTDVSAELRIVVCDSRGKMISIVTGRATVSGARTQIAQLREQALAAAVGGMTDSLQSQLARAVG
jgi:hypothetical protein